MCLINNLFSYKYLQNWFWRWPTTAVELKCRTRTEEFTNSAGVAQIAEYHYLSHSTWYLLYSLTHLRNLCLCTLDTAGRFWGFCLKIYITMWIEVCVFTMVVCQLVDSQSSPGLFVRTCKSGQRWGRIKTPSGKSANSPGNCGCLSPS